MITTVRLFQRPRVHGSFHTSKCIQICPKWVLLTLNSNRHASFSSQSSDSLEEDFAGINQPSATLVPLVRKQTTIKIA